jgi:DNA-binding IclR family transcriptional regulator
LINNFTQCFAAPIFGIDGYAEATICLVLPLNVPEAQIEVLKWELIASGKKLSMEGSNK